MLNFGRARTQQRQTRPTSFGGKNQNLHNNWIMVHFCNICYNCFLIQMGWVNLCNENLFVHEGLDYADPKRKSNFAGKFILAAALTALCIFLLKQSPTFSSPSPVSPWSYIKISSICWVLCWLRVIIGLCNYFSF